MKPESQMSTETWNRLNLYAKVILFAEVVGIIVIVAAHLIIPELRGHMVLGNDFQVFWAAGHIAQTGSPADAYQLRNIFAVMLAHNPALAEPKAWFGWFYPPTFLAVAEGLASLPLIASFFTFVTLTFAAYVTVVRRATNGMQITWLLLAFPPVIISAFNGQNSFLTAALAGFALMEVDKRPILAGVCVGLLSIKPQLAILFPIAFACGGHWRAFAAAAVTTVGLLALSVAHLGMDSLYAFWGGVQAARGSLLTSEWPLYKMPSVLAAGLGAGLGFDEANFVQGAFTLTGALIVGWSWRQRWPAEIRNSAFILATLIATPHVFDYDLTWLGLAIAWATSYGMREGWSNRDRLAVAAIWLAPMICGGIARAFGPNLTFVPIVFSLWCLTQMNRQPRCEQGLQSI